MLADRVPFFSILTASFNKGDTLGETLESVRNQTYESVEHIVVDGGSTDCSVGELRKYQNKYNLKWVSERDRGISEALNKGLRLAKGRYVLVLHADDKLAANDTLEIVHSLLRDERYDVYSFPVIRDEGINRKVLYKPIKILWWHHFKTIFPHQGAFIHRRVYERIGEFREELVIGLDYDFFYRALKSRSTVRFHTYPVAIMGGEGISSNQDFLLLRLREESYVQIMNESNPFWRASQYLFRTAYVPYKTRLIPYWRTHFNGVITHEKSRHSDQGFSSVINARERTSSSKSSCYEKDQQDDAPHQKKSCLRKVTLERLVNRVMKTDVPNYLYYFSLRLLYRITGRPCKTGETYRARERRLREGFFDKYCQGIHHRTDFSSQLKKDGTSHEYCGRL